MNLSGISEDWYKEILGKYEKLQFFMNIMFEYDNKVALLES